ncbi:MAG: protein kinase [Myxococcaceae bacterium]|nr:protein kinase [Myxococcaceae bacterium]
MSAPPSPKGAPVDPLIGERVGDHVVEAIIGSGGMGLVYRAIHPLIQRKVAVKVLKPEVAANPEFKRRFLAEAQALAAIKHRGITDIISFGTLRDGREYLVMEFLEGESLESLLAREGQLDPMRALSLCDEILDALSAAHGAGIVHRDLKPANVFLLEQSNGSVVVKLVDFGLARVTDAALVRNSGKESLVAGTPEYISPEQAQGYAAVPQSDLYSLGAMLYELLTGQLPFEAQGVYALMKAHVEQVPPRLSARLSVPKSLDDLAFGLLEKEPQRRPPSANVVRNRIKAIARELQQETTRLDGRSLPEVPGASAPATTRPAASDTDVQPPTSFSTRPAAADTDVQPRARPPQNRTWLGAGAALLGVALVGVIGAVLFYGEPPAVEPRSPGLPARTLHSDPVDPPPLEVSAVREPPAVDLAEASEPVRATPQAPPAPVAKAGPKRIDAAVKRWCSKDSWKHDISVAAARAGRSLLKDGNTAAENKLSLMVQKLRESSATQDSCAKSAPELDRLLRRGGEQ